MILALILWNMMSIEDIIYFQSNRYQKDRYLQSSDVYIQDVFHMLLLACIFIFLFYLDLSILYPLCILMILPSRYNICKEMFHLFVITNRIKRLFIYILLFNLILLSLIFILHELFMQIFLIFMIYFHHQFFYIFVLISTPLENKIRENYVNKAKKKLERFQGMIIGITGSYGKTSIKNLIYDVLTMKYSCLKTRGSYNNKMGITKTILEEMNHQEIFICEMGADHLHEIEDLCDFVHPHLGILSNVGPQHLSTFHSIENILFEKMKILECLDENGHGFYNFDNFYLYQQDMSLKCKVTRVGIHHYSDIKAINISCNHLGSSFDVEIDNQLIPFKTSLLGEHNILNCLFAIAVGLYLKVDISLIQLALLTTKPTPHRHELKPFYKGFCIDNAYNSNPISAKASLDVLKMMPKRHILITPGFIDLGENHAYYSEEFGKQMSFCDKIILIGTCKDIKKGLMNENYLQENIYQVNKMQDALILASTLIQENDTLLIENDIPENLIIKEKK